MHRIFSKEPEFYVFYNGEAPYSCDKTLKLSDAFVEKAGEVNLELTVKVINNPDASVGGLKPPHE